MTKNIMQRFLRFWTSTCLFQCWMEISNMKCFVLQKSCTCLFCFYKFQGCFSRFYSKHDVNFVWWIRWVNFKLFRMFKTVMIDLCNSLYYKILQKCSYILGNKEHLEEKELIWINSLNFFSSLIEIIRCSQKRWWLSL